MNALIHRAFLLNTVFLFSKLPMGLLAQAADQANPPVLRGTPMVLGRTLEASVAFATDVKNWQQVKDLGLNTVRVCWVDPWYADHNYAHWTAEEVLPKLDKCVTNAQATGLNVIINYHNVGEQHEQTQSGKPLNFSRLASFWRLAAPRYTNQTRVFYELSNEPSFDGSMFLKPEFHAGLMGVYRQVRQDAPQRTVLLFSFNSTDPDLKGIVDTYASEIDWAHTMVAFISTAAMPPAERRESWPRPTRPSARNGTTPVPLNTSSRLTENCSFPKPARTWVWAGSTGEAGATRSSTASVRA